MAFIKRFTFFPRIADKSIFLIVARVAAATSSCSTANLFPPPCPGIPVNEPHPLKSTNNARNRANRDALTQKTQIDSFDTLVLAILNMIEIL